VIRTFLCIVVAAVMAIGINEVVTPISMAGAVSLADGCTTSVGRPSAVSGPATTARCSGGYTGRIGYFRAKQKCHWWGVSTTMQYGSWVQIRSGNWSQTAPCDGLWMDGSGYELSPP
jgi:hypothetical protein